MCRKGRGDDGPPSNGEQRTERPGSSHRDHIEHGVSLCGCFFKGHFEKHRHKETLCSLWLFSFVAHHQRGSSSTSAFRIAAIPGALGHGPYNTDSNAM